MKEEILFKSQPMEQAVIGACLLEKAAMAKVMGLIEPIMFTDQRNRIVWMAMTDMHRSGELIDTLTVAKRLRALKLIDDIGGVGYLAELTINVVTAAHVQIHAQSLVQDYMSKQIDQLCMGARLAVKGEHDPLKVLEDLKTKLALLEPKSRRSKMTTVGEIWIEEGSKKIQENIDRFRSGDILAGAPTGFHELDEVMLGMEPGNMYLFAGSTSMGKTSIMLRIAMACAMAGHPVGIRSLEMTKIELVFRLAAYGAEISTWRMKKGDISSADFAALNAAINDAIANLIVVEDSGGTGSEDLYRWYGQFAEFAAKKSKKFPVFMMDFIQRATAKGKGTREQEVGEVSRRLKDVSMDFGGPMVPLSQLSRGVDQGGGDHKPELWHLRESGSLEQDANFVAFLYRAEKYGITQYDDGSSTAGVGEILVKKYREGGLVDIKLGFSGAFGWHNFKGGSANGGESSQLEMPVIKPKDITIPNSERMRDSEEKGDFFPF